MRFLLDNGAPESYFKDYLSLDISPHHIHKTKGEHKCAVLALAKSISAALSDNSEMVPSSLSQRINRLYVRCRKELA